MKNIFEHPLMSKFACVIVLFFLVLIPVSMVKSLIQDRDKLQQNVIQEIAASSSGAQQIVGPIIRVLYSDTTEVDGKPQQVMRQRLILPNDYDVNAKLSSFEKYRGIYHARLYNAQTSLQGTFDLSALTDLSHDQIKGVALIVSVKDSRGLLRLDQMTLAGHNLTVYPGTSIDTLSQGFYSPIDVRYLNLSAPVRFDLNFLLQGMGELKVAPIGKMTEVTMSSEWPHPSFIGDSLPISSKIQDSGFTAQWSSNHLSSNIGSLIDACVTRGAACDALAKRQMGVALIEPVDHYLKSYRAVNYAALVIMMVFASFFLLEIFQARPVHPVQYGFVGLALALFYLVLISFSEHIGFNLAYSVSALASTALLSIYVSGILKNRKHGALFAAGLLALYGMLFGLLQAESYALLMGTTLCFAVLSVLMILTRDVDWYAYGAKRSSNEEATAAQQPDGETQPKVDDWFASYERNPILSTSKDEPSK
ncbi:Inner membrane protein CreD [Vibrio stylophorae]|uniref:Inner membrane protein CreD n=1 Tax=Vibrio stylophorae TaxID=659351 RepID=A0ABN8DUD8_9VIBR|nr:cell envelope integrity protein CreD [Vibrio stylophorae]CAH0533606.1 Inner membrane protein CreD [Vibrio stylophorae]